MRTFTYTDDSRIASISDNSVGVGSYAYGGFGTRTSKTENSVSNTFIRDGMGVTAPVLRDSNASYTAGISERRGSDTTYQHSGLKNVEAQSDANETISAAASYDAFGNLISSSGTWNGPFGYAGAFGYQQDATGYKLLGHRYYDPDAGRFLTSDPVYSGSNWWIYPNNPVTGADPSGLFEVIIFIDKNGEGVGVVVAEAGDVIPKPGGKGEEIVAEGGEIVMWFPVSNNTYNPDESPNTLEGGGPFPPGTYDITGTNRRYRSQGGAGAWLGPTVFIEGKIVDWRGRGTWLHGGAGDNWRAKTEGCIRGTDSDMNRIISLYLRNKGNGNRHRVTVFDARRDENAIWNWGSAVFGLPNPRRWLGGSRN